MAAEPRKVPNCLPGLQKSKETLRKGNASVLSMSKVGAELFYPWALGTQIQNPYRLDFACDYSVELAFFRLFQPSAKDIVPDIGGFIMPPDIESTYRYQHIIIQCLHQHPSLK